MRINRFIDIGRPSEAELVKKNPSLARLLPPDSQEVSLVLQRTDEIMAGMAPPNPPPIMDPHLARPAEITPNPHTRSDTRYTPEQRSRLLVTAAPEAT